MSARTGFCILVVAIAACEPRGVTFHLENGDSAPLDSVVVFTTGHKYQLGTLAPGERRTVVVDAKGESHFEIEHGVGERHRLKLGGYFEGGYSGSFFARVRRDSVLAVADSVRT
jgi:hypothetical protein